MTDLDHLAPECWDEALLDTEGRIHAILTERWINYPRAAFALQRLEHLLMHPARDRMPCLLLFGATGMGKTKIVRKFLRSHPTLFNTRTGISGVPIVSMQMPPDPDEKAFYLQLLNSVNAPTRYGHTVYHLRHIVRDLLEFTNTRMIVIDEVHTLLASTYRQQRVLLNTLRFLANELRVSLVCAGTADAKRALLIDQQLADRFEAVELPAWRNDSDFKRLLASFQALLPLRKPSELSTAEIRQEILRRTEGITVRIVRLLEHLAIDAVRSGAEAIPKRRFYPWKQRVPNYENRAIMAGVVPPYSRRAPVFMVIENCSTLRTYRLGTPTRTNNSVALAPPRTGEPHDRDADGLHWRF